MFYDISYYWVMFHVATACPGASVSTLCFNFWYKAMVFMQQSFDNFEKQTNKLGLSFNWDLLVELVYTKRDWFGLSGMGWKILFGTLCS